MNICYFCNKKIILNPCSLAKPFPKLGLQDISLLKREGRLGRRLLQLQGSRGKGRVLVAVLLSKVSKTLSEILQADSHLHLLGQNMSQGHLSCKGG